jgi:hypothetical protein
MRKHLPLVLLLAASAASPIFAQTAPSTTATQPKQFCRLAIRVKENGLIGYIALTYGQESKLNPSTDRELAAESAKVDSLDSEPQVLNYLSSCGWEIVGYNSITSVYFTYLLQRPAK